VIINGVKMLEFCRECRDERDEYVPAQFIIWGKLCSPDKLGPRCYEHTQDLVGFMDQVNQWAIFDLRGLVDTPESPEETI